VYNRASHQKEVAMEYTKERAMEWLDKRWKREKRCPICQSNSWTVGDSLGVMLPMIDDKINPYAPTYPLFVVACTECAYTLFFNAVIAGLYPPASQEKKES
jgi:hypothetical protein